MKNAKQAKEAAAFTLIEVLVAMLVLAIGLLGLAGITVVVLRSNTLSLQISEATNIASTLMEELRRTAALPDCAATSAFDAAGMASCDILQQSGIARQSDAAFYPPLTNVGAVCGVTGLLDGLGAAGNAFTFDAISGNFTGRTDYSSDSNICDVSNTPRGSPYIRYYRTSLPSLPIGGTVNERRMVVVVLWQDKFGKWRNVKLDTRRTGNN